MKDFFINNLKYKSMPVKDFAGKIAVYQKAPTDVLFTELAGSMKYMLMGMLRKFKPCPPSITWGEIYNTLLIGFNRGLLDLKIDRVRLEGIPSYLKTCVAREMFKLYAKEARTIRLPYHMASMLSALACSPIVSSEIENMSKEDIISSEFIRRKRVFERSSDTLVDKAVSLFRQPIATVAIMGDPGLPYDSEKREGRDVHAAVDLELFKQWLQTEGLSELSPTDRLIISSRMELEGCGKMTYEQLGEEIGRTKERVRQREKAAVEKLSRAFKEKCSFCC